MHGSKRLLTLCQIINKPDIPSLADEIAEPHPNMNIKVTAFTVSEKSSNTEIINYFHARLTLACHFILHKYQNSNKWGGVLTQNIRQRRIS